jgi:DNA-directed RNA polymerase subunit RPC12/RpoP
VECLSCGEQISVSATTADERVRCKVCGATIRVAPSAASVKDSVRSEEVKLRKVRRQAGAKSRQHLKTSILMIAGIVSAVVVVIFTVGWVAFGTHSASEPPPSVESAAVASSDHRVSPTSGDSTQTPSEGPKAATSAITNAVGHGAESVADSASESGTEPQPQGVPSSESLTTPAIESDPELDRFEGEIRAIVEKANELARLGDDGDAARVLRSLNQPLSGWLNRIRSRKLRLEQDLEMSGPLQELKGKTFASPQDWEREVLPLRRKVNREQYVRLAKLIAGQAPARDAIAALQQDIEFLTAGWKHLMAVCADWSRRRGILETSLKDAIRLASEIRMRQDSQDVSTTELLQKQLLQLTGSRESNSPFRFGTAAISYNSVMARVESEWASMPVFEIAGNNALELLSGGENGSSLAGTDLLLGLPIRFANRLTLSLVEMDESQWRMLSRWSSVENLRLQRSLLAGKIPEGSTLPELESLTLNGGTIAQRTLASLLTATRPKELVMENVTIEGEGGGSFPLDRLAIVKITGCTGAEPLLRVIIDANVSTELYVDHGMISSAEWSRIDQMASLKKLTIRTPNSGPVEVRAEHLEPLAKCPSLEELWIFDGVGKNAANAVAALRQLRMLHLPGLSGRFRWSNPPKACSWQVLSMSGDFELSDDVLRELGQCTELREVSLRAVMRIERSVPGSETPDRPVVPPAGDIGLTSIARLPQLESLSLFPTHVTDQGLSLLQKHPRLKMVQVSSDKISADAPAMLADSLPQLRDRIARRIFFLGQADSNYIGRVSGLNVTTPVRAGERPLRNWIEDFRVGLRTEIWWLPGTPVDTVVALKDGSLSLRELLDQLTATTRTSWDFDGERIYVFPSEAAQRVRRRLDQQPELMRRSARVETLRWLTQVPQPFDVNGTSLGDLIRQFTSVYKAPADAIVIDPNDAKLALRKVTLVVPRIRQQGDSIIRQLDFMTLMLDLDWMIDTKDRIVLRSLKNR